jgi:hypothetical protein
MSIVCGEEKTSLCVSVVQITYLSHNYIVIVSVFYHRDTESTEKTRNPVSTV